MQRGKERRELEAGEERARRLLPMQCAVRRSLARRAHEARAATRVAALSLSRFVLVANAARIFSAAWNERETQILRNAAAFDLQRFARLCLAQRTYFSTWTTAQHEQASIVLQGAWLCNRARCSLLILQRLAAAEAEVKEHAAVVIQTLARKRAALAYVERRRSLIIRLQARWRGAIIRFRMMDATRCAVLIQSVYRGHCFRRVAALRRKVVEMQQPQIVPAEPFLHPPQVPERTAAPGARGAQNLADANAERRSGLLESMKTAPRFKAFFQALQADSVPQDEAREAEAVLGSKTPVVANAEDKGEEVPLRVAADELEAPAQLPESVERFSAKGMSSAERLEPPVTLQAPPARGSFFAESVERRVPPRRLKKQKQRERAASLASNHGGSTAALAVPPSAQVPARAGRKRADAHLAAKSAVKSASASAFAAARFGRSKDLCSALDGGMSIEVRDSDKNTLLMVAALNGHKGLCRTLMKRGASLAAQNDRGNTALHMAYRFNNVQVAEYLISKGANESIRNDSGQTAAEYRETYQVPK